MASSASKKVNPTEVLDLLNKIVGKDIFDLKGGMLVAKRDPHINSPAMKNESEINNIFKDVMQRQGVRDIYIDCEYITPDMIEKLRGLVPNKALDEKTEDTSNLTNLLNVGRPQKLVSKTTKKPGMYVVFGDDESFAAAKKALESHPELKDSYRVAGTERTFQIYNSLQVDDSGKVIIADAQRLLNFGKPLFVQDPNPLGQKKLVFLTFNDDVRFEGAKKALESNPDLKDSYRILKDRTIQIGNLIKLNADDYTITIAQNKPASRPKQ